MTTIVTVATLENTRVDPNSVRSKVNMNDKQLFTYKVVQQITTEIHIVQINRHTTEISDDVAWITTYVSIKHYA